MSENSEKKEITINKEKWKSHLKDFFYPFVIVFLILIIIVHFSYAMDCCNDVVYISIPEFLNLGEFESYEGFKTIFVRGDYDNHKYYLGDPSVWGTSEIYYNYFTRLINYYIPYVLIESIPPTNCIFENKGMRWIFAEKKYAKLARGNS